MEPEYRLAETDLLERGLLLSGGSDSESFHDENEDEGPALYTASFSESEENLVKYQTARWVLYSLLLILAWGFGFFMLFYLPVRRYILRRDIRSRKLYVTPNSIVYKVRRPVTFPCFGVLKREKHVLLPSVANVVIEQGYMQSLFGVYSVRIVNIGVTRPPTDDVQIEGVVNPHAFKKAVLVCLANMRAEVLSGQVPTIEDIPTTPKIGHSSVASMSPSRRALRQDFGEMAILQKLEEVGNSVKRVETLIGETNTVNWQTKDVASFGHKTFSLCLHMFDVDK